MTVRTQKFIATVKRVKKVFTDLEIQDIEESFEKLWDAANVSDDEVLTDAVAIVHEWLAYIQEAKV